MSVVFHGERFAGYRILELIGWTAQATVYRALDPVRGRTVALKILDVRPDEPARQRFLRESATARDLHHPHILPIHEIGEAGDRLFVATRYVPDGDLDAVLGGGRLLDRHRVVALLTEVASALDAAHAHGLVHGDVKPSNILVETTGGTEHAYLADFGTARYLDGARLTVTNTGTWTGPPEYMAPEQVDGVAVDAGTDVYALGRVLSHCLVAPTLAGRSHRLPAGLDEVLARALARRTEDRHPTATAFLAAVRIALAEPGHRDPAATALDPAPAAPRRPRRRSLVMVTALAATILAGAGGLAVGLHGQERTGIPSTASSGPQAPPGAAGLLGPDAAAISPLPSPTPVAVPPATAAPSSSATQGAAPTTQPATAPAAPPTAPAIGVGTSAPGDSLFHATVRNTGQAQLVAGAASLSDTTGAAIVDDGCAGAHLPPGGSCVVTVRVQPPGPGDYTTILSVPIAGGQPVTFTLHAHRS